MFWFTGLLVFIFLIAALVLLSVLVIEVDTRIPQAVVRWGHLGKAKIWYDEEWWLSMQLPFYRKTMRVAEIKTKPAKKEIATTKKKPVKKITIKRVVKKAVAIIQTFQLQQCKLSIDTDDYVRNAQLYPLNFLPEIRNHICINFMNENFLVLKVRNYPWKILYAFIKS